MNGSDIEGPTEDANRPVAIVTGASRGLGRAIAEELAKRGMAVVVAARDLAACEEVAREIRGVGGEALAVACDITSRGEVEAVVREALAHFGRLDVLVNNAGTIEPICRLSECDIEAWERSIRVNLLGAFYAIRAVLPHFQEAGGGVIIDISSGAAQRPLEGWSAYCSSKAGLAMLTRCVAHEQGDDGILAYGVRPGVVDTDMQVKIRASGVNEVSQLPRESLLPPEVPARFVADLCLLRPKELSGTELSVGDPRVAALLGEG